MPPMFYKAFITLFIVSVAFASDVVELTVDNFEHETQISTGATTGDWFIKFYAPWCGHCKRLAPTWEEVATELKGKINVAKVDVTQNRALGDRFGIKGFPTLLFFKRGKMAKYQGQRSKESLIEFALNTDIDNINDDIPGPVGAVKTTLTKMVGVLENTVTIAIKSPMSCIILMFVGGMIGFLIGLLCGGPSYEPIPPPPPTSSYARQPIQQQQQTSSTATGGATGTAGDADDEDDDDIPMEPKKDK